MLSLNGQIKVHLSQLKKNQNKYLQLKIERTDIKREIMML